MLSGNGRHRRPRQAPAILVAAGVTGSAIAIPLLGATGASAADGTVWDKVAECESGGSWSADEGTGQYGGLQLTQEDWEKYGGLDYASSPDLASRSQQIAVAQDILADQGTSPWGTCAVLNGLTKKSGALDLDTGVAEDSPSEVSGSSGLLDSSGSSDSSDSSGSADDSNLNDDPSGAPSESSDASSESSRDSAASPSSSSSSPSADDSATSDTSPDTKASQSPDSSPVENPKADNQDNLVQDVGSWSLVDTGAVDAGASGSGRHRGPSADESKAADGAADSAKSSGRHASYDVRAGDTLASIADSLDVEGGWRALYEANKDAIGTDANHIFAGQTLDVPGE
ncbi:transglycosylase family protein [Streptomyces viridochromogenes]|uniref:LysM peptidoglycan-binding domain-containing protein n=1 Tax=Streptomyces viridochromogenes TaxID=1938 RepID=UPI00069E43BE|nr:transglycosylase family protein [Streptomyces viridochromogenes]KOG19586.1 peptigoglycan-binding protein LysM [Streptomyces viridochromogenes]KOG23057.1 peptigoglycan-binding protein LysM [Streptomyces viridochromogenes]